jgi:hypothetical protein
MVSQYAIAWKDSAGVRRVGRLVLSQTEVTLDGTETAPPRRRARVQTDRADVTAANVLRDGELPAVQIVTAAGILVVELVTGGRGAALALAHELSGRAA